MRSLKSFLLLLILLTLSASALQYHSGFFHERPLKGFYVRSDKPGVGYFARERWLSGDFQEVTTYRLNNNIGFRTSLIQIFNQCDYSLFGLAHAKGFIRGKEQFLFEEDYIHEYTGQYFIGNKILDTKLAMLKNVRDSLAAYQIPLILVIEPGKAGFHPEYIPGRFNPEEKSQSNYDYLVERCAALGLPFLDLNRHFMAMKDTSKFPLFPKYGMHWSLYGAHLAADTLAKYVEYATGKTMNKFAISKLHHSSNSLGTDYDIGEILNLLCPLKPTPGVYPMVNFSKISDGTLSALVIADSYYLNLVDSYGKKMFGKQDFWYYNSKLYPFQNQDTPTYADKSDLREKLKKYNVVMLMSSEINLHCGFWNFAEEAFYAFHPELNNPHLERIENSIRNDRDWFRSMVAKSKSQSSPLSQMVRADAEFVFFKAYDNLDGKSAEDSIQYIRLTIRNSPEWLAIIAKKAVERNIPIDSMMMLDAIYTYNQLKKKE